MPLKRRHSELSEAGDFCYYETSGVMPARDDQIAGMIIRCPGCNVESAVSFHPEDRVHWEWDGDREKPTLSPSLNSVGCCGWHGWLREGQWVSV